MTFYYLGALSIGYYVGYFLLVFGAKPTGRPRLTATYVPAVNALVLALVVIVINVAPAALLYRNLAQIRATNGPMVKQYATELTRSLPAAGVVMSDDNRLLGLAQLLLGQQGKGQEYLFLDTGSAVFADYHWYLKKKNPRLWQGEPPVNRTKRLEPMDAINLLTRLSKSNEVAYLHPSFGYYFEYFYAVPHGMTFALKPYGTNIQVVPPLSPELISQNETFLAAAQRRILFLASSLSYRAQKPRRRMPWVRRFSGCTFPAKPIIRR